MAVARLVGLPVDTWRAGDPTRTQFRAQAEALDALEAVQVELAKSAFLSTSEGEWKTLRAKDVYGIDREAATFAAPTVTLDNAGGGLFVLEPGGLVVAASATSAPFTNQDTVTISPLTAGIVVQLVAQQAGSAGSVAADDIDTLVSPTLTGVTIASSTAAIGTDEQSDPGLDEQCLATLGALSPDGAADAYEYVARNSVFTGVQGITRAKSVGDNATGTVLVYVATTAAGVSGPTVTAIQTAIDLWATPLCTGATVASATPVPVDVDLTGVSASEQDFLETALTAFFGTVDLGELVARDAITSAVRVALAGAGRPVAGAITMAVPAADVTLADSEFPVLGALTL
jgi:hypothetical protein